MSARRIVGIETEYGIAVPGNPSANSMLTSSQVVNAYASATARARRARWDFEEESPLRDARGFELSRDGADPSQLTDEEVGLANVILTNGARLYVDHAHPEYSSPEVTSPRDAIRWDKAGELVMAEAARLAALVPGWGRTATGTASRSPSGLTISRSRSDSRPHSSGRSSTPGTSRTRIPSGIAACT